MQVTNWPIDKVKPFHNNSRVHDDKSISAIKSSVDRFDWLSPIVVDKDGVIIAGHGRLAAARELGMEEVPVLVADWLTENEAAAAREADNMTQDLSFFDMDLLNANLAEIDWLDVDMTDFGFKLDDELNNFDGGGFDFDADHGNLTDRYGQNPFSVLNASSSEWNKRKQEWNEIIGDDNSRGDSQLYPDSLDKLFPTKEKRTNSSLDPVLVETLLTWFAPDDGASVFDCFAGDPQGGFVASYKGYDYTGIELRKEQVEINEKISKGNKKQPKYICDDGCNIARHIKKSSQDLLISCPPYYDLEIYSDKENDASNQESFDDFYAILNKAFSESIPLLKDNRFACVICTDLRDKQGFYYDFTERIRDTFEKNGMRLYNNLILYTPIGTAAIRANRSMTSRKPVRVHQNVLVFLKGTADGVKEEFRSMRFEDVSENE